MQRHDEIRAVDGTHWFGAEELREEDVFSWLAPEDDDEESEEETYSDTISEVWADYDEWN